MAIYTRTGDEGMTSLRGDQPRVSKSHWQIEMVGSIDEISSHIGVARAMIVSWSSLVQEDKKNQLLVYDSLMRELQSDMFVMGALLVSKVDTVIMMDPSTLYPGGKDLDNRIRHVEGGGRHQQQLADLGKRTRILEQMIDQMDSDLTPLRNFIMSGGSVISAEIMLTRSVVRRTERQFVRWIESQIKQSRKHNQDSHTGWVSIYWQPINGYLNRLSDLLFVLARHVNHTFEFDEELWSGS